MSNVKASTEINQDNVVDLATIVDHLNIFWEAEAYGVSKNQPERQAMLITGPPGLGKTEVVKQFVRTKNRANLAAGGNGVGLIVFRLTQAEISDLKGVPCYKDLDGKKVCIYASPEIFPQVGMPHTAINPDNGLPYDKVVIFFDELLQAVPVLQQMAGNVLDGIIGDHELDFDRTFIIAAGNRQQDNATVFPMPSNLASRFAKYSVNGDWKLWEAWALESGIDSTVLGFLNEKYGSYLHEPINKNGQVFATPRGWHKMSLLLQTVETMTHKPWVQDVSKYVDLIYSKIGVKAGSEFIAYAKGVAELFDINAIEEGRDHKVPEKACYQFSLIYEILSRTTRHLDFVNSDEWKNAAEDSNKKDEILNRNIKPESIEKIGNMNLWIANKIKAEELNAAVFTAYRSLMSTEIKYATQRLQLDPKHGKNLKKAVDLQMEMYQLANGKGKK